MLARIASVTIILGIILLFIVGIQAAKSIFPPSCEDVRGLASATACTQLLIGE